MRSAGRSDDAGVASGETKLPHIDEHAIVIAAGDPGRVWNALGETIERYWRVPNLGVRMLRAEPATRSGNPLITGSTIPGFIVARAEPSKDLALQGRHRFSSYALIFRMATNDGRTTLSAETRAAFPGVSGCVYRGLVIGTRGHVLVVRGLLRSTRRRAER